MQHRLAAFHYILMNLKLQSSFIKKVKYLKIKTKGNNFVFSCKCVNIFFYPDRYNGVNHRHLEDVFRKSFPRDQANIFKDRGVLKSYIPNQ